MEILASTNASLAACGVPPKDVSRTVIAIPASFGSLAILMVIARLADRLLVHRITLGWDDYLVGTAVVCVWYPSFSYGHARFLRQAANEASLVPRSAQYQ